MQDYQQRFIDLAIRREVLRFGQFTLKSGRVSPYFFNAGGFCTGEDLLELGRCYAAAFAAAKVPCDTLFGPAYKGIPLVCAMAMALAQEHGLSLPWSFNRKEKKDHGEGGSIVGAPLQGEVTLVDDVITAGTAIREGHGIISAAGGHLSCAVIALDREERGQGGMGAIPEAERDLGIRVVPIIRLSDLIAYLEGSPTLGEHLPAMLDYRERYGA
ncbi:MAG: orotate phosphoribosyltransferase [Succinivibrionaceae bacterium]|nr:orotate phosphoribosyltransferase [Succinivibrionaceae bacterium]